jgi:flagellar protein FlaJ
VGGSIATLEALARFTFSLAEFEKELRSRLKPYVFMPYFGALINAVATLMVISFTSETLKLSVSAAGISLPLLVLYFTVSMLINGWLMGLVAGKISGRYLAAGFTHAIALVTMIYITVMLVLQRYFAF